MRKVTRKQRNLGEWVENAVASFHNTKIFIESDNSRIHILELSNATRQISLDFELKSDEFSWYKRPCRPCYTRAQFEFSQNMYIAFVPHSINMILFFSFSINVQRLNGRDLFMLYCYTLNDRWHTAFLFFSYILCTFDIQLFISFNASLLFSSLKMFLSSFTANITDHIVKYRKISKSWRSKWVCIRSLTDQRVNDAVFFLCMFGWKSIVCLRPFSGGMRSTEKKKHSIHFKNKREKKSFHWYKRITAIVICVRVWWVYYFKISIQKCK